MYEDFNFKSYSLLTIPESFESLKASREEKRVDGLKELVLSSNKFIFFSISFTWDLTASNDF